MTPLLLAPMLRPVADPPLDPSPDEARSLLRRELLAPEYHEQDLLQRVVRWLERLVARGVENAGDVPPVQALAVMLVVALLVCAAGLVLSRARRTARAGRVAGPVLGVERVSADDLRARALAALDEGRHEDAVVDGFRAIALRQVERGRLDDAPGTTAHEVALVLGAHHPHLAARVVEGAALFDAVHYGRRTVDAARAAAVLALDEDLGARR